MVLHFYTDYATDLGEGERVREREREGGREGRNVMYSSKHFSGFLCAYLHCLLSVH